MAMLIYNNNNIFIIQINRTNVSLIEQYDEMNHVKKNNELISTEVKINWEEMINSNLNNHITIKTIQNLNSTTILKNLTYKQWKI